MAMSFKVGDKVRLTPEAWHCPSNQIGIVMEVGSNFIGIFYKGWYEGHSLAGRLPDRHANSGWYLPKSCVILVESMNGEPNNTKEDSPLIKKIKYLEHKFKTRHDVQLKKKEEEWYDF
jgi:hypothetical protein